MLLELCVAYTSAINTGSVPNIQNAWSYVCQNECQRIIDLCIRKFEELIDEPFERAKQEMDIGILKKSNKAIVEECVIKFRKDAMGGQDSQGTIQELEFKLRLKIGEKYKIKKQDFVRYCQIKAKKYLDEQTQTIRRNIQQAIYESLDAVQDDLNQIKSDYQGPKYPGYEILLAESMCELVAKASDYLSIGQSQNAQINIKRLTERVKDLEQEIKEERIEH